MYNSLIDSLVDRLEKEWKKSEKNINTYVALKFRLKDILADQDISTILLLNSRFDRNLSIAERDYNKLDYFLDLVHIVCMISILSTNFIFIENLSKNIRILIFVASALIVGVYYLYMRYKINETFKWKTFLSTTGETIDETR